MIADYPFYFLFIETYCGLAMHFAHHISVSFYFLFIETQLGGGERIMRVITIHLPFYFLFIETRTSLAYRGRRSRAKSFYFLFIETEAVLFGWRGTSRSPPLSIFFSLKLAGCSLNRLSVSTVTFYFLFIETRCSWSIRIRTRTMPFYFLFIET